MTGFGTTPGLPDVAVIVSVWVLSFEGPGLIPVSETFCGPGFTFTVTSFNEFNVGASFALVTVTVNVLVRESTPPLAVPPLSLTTTVIVLVPNCVATGAKVNDPVALGFA